MRQIDYLYWFISNVYYIGWIETMVSITIKQNKLYFYVKLTLNFCNNTSIKFTNFIHIRINTKFIFLEMLVFYKYILERKTLNLIFKANRPELMLSAFLVILDTTYNTIRNTIFVTYVIKNYPNNHINVLYRNCLIPFAIVKDLVTRSLKRKNIHYQR